MTCLGTIVGVGPDIYFEIERVEFDRSDIIFTLDVPILDGKIKVASQDSRRRVEGQLQKMVNDSVENHYL